MSKIVLKTIGLILLIEAAFMLLPVIIAFIYGESDWKYFLLIIAGAAIVGGLLYLIKPSKRRMHAKEGFIIVGLAWLVMSLVGAIPYVLSGLIPNYLNAVFEAVSGFTTSGVTIIADIEVGSHAILFWRSLTHWIGGMGVLVFTMAVLPKSNEHSVRLMHVMRAEVPGPVVGKLVSRVKSTARILYGIYIALTLLETVLLLAGGMPLFDALCNTFGTAGTGGFCIWNDSIAHYHSAYADMVIGVFMLLFSLNFNLYFLLLLRQFRPVFKNSELRWFLSIVAVATAAVMIDVRHLYPGFFTNFRYSFFQVISVTSTTGFATADFNQWPILSKTVLVLLMFMGACAGSTGGGLKVGRIMLLVKTFVREVRLMLHPRSVHVIRTDGKRVDEETVRGTASYFITYMLLFAGSFLLLAILDDYDMVTNATAVSACMNNIGPGLEIVGPTGNYSLFCDASKLILTLDMLAGRLELFPILMIFAPTTWKKH